VGVGKKHRLHVVLHKRRVFTQLDVGHHAALEAEFRGLAVIDGGHFYTEKAAFTLFAKGLKGLLKKRGWEVEVTGYSNEQNPLNYIF